MYSARAILTFSFHGHWEAVVTNSIDYIAVVPYGTGSAPIMSRSCSNHDELLPTWHCMDLWPKVTMREHAQLALMRASQKGVWPSAAGNSLGNTPGRGHSCNAVLSTPEQGLAGFEQNMVISRNQFSTFYVSVQVSGQNFKEKKRGILLEAGFSSFLFCFVLFCFVLIFFSVGLNIALAPPFWQRKEEKINSKSKTAFPFPQAVLFHSFSVYFLYCLALHSPAKLVFTHHST